MAEKTDDEKAPDRRRNGDRRSGKDTGYTGPERRLGDRRSGEDRRKSPRF